MTVEKQISGPKASKQLTIVCGELVFPGGTTCFILSPPVFPRGSSVYFFFRSLCSSPESRMPFKIFLTGKCFDLWSKSTSGPTCESCSLGLGETEVNRDPNMDRDWNCTFQHTVVGRSPCKCQRLQLRYPIENVIVM